MSIAMQSITAEKLKERMSAEAAAQIIDVRPAVLYRAMHVKGTRNIAHHKQLLAALKERKDGETAYLVCNEGNVSKAMCSKLAAAGVTGVVNVEGGTKACMKAGLAVETGDPGVSLERQVRIAAGSLVLIGVALGFGVHPGFFGLSAFVGAGLTFAGITDTCGMAMLLARMPWNR